jgi:NitT/TauT family transport system substrate-binding protein
VDLGQDFQAMTAALTTGAIDAASQPEPTATLATETGVGVKWREVSDVLPGLQLTVVLFGPRLTTQRSDIAERWMAAYLKGVRDYHAAMIKNGPGRDDIISILSRSTPVTDPLLYPKMGFPYIDPNGEPNQQSLADQLRYAQEQGLVTSALDIQQVVDTHFAEAAVSRIGRYVL